MTPQSSWVAAEQRTRLASMRHLCAAMHALVDSAPFSAPLRHRACGARSMCAAGAAPLQVSYLSSATLSSTFPAHGSRVQRACWARSTSTSCAGPTSSPQRPTSRCGAAGAWPTAATRCGYCTYERNDTTDLEVVTMLHAGLRGLGVACAGLLQWVAAAAVHQRAEDDGKPAVCACARRWNRGVALASYNQSLWLPAATIVCRRRW